MYDESIRFYNRHPELDADAGILFLKLDKSTTLHSIDELFLQFYSPAPTAGPATPDTPPSNTAPAPLMTYHPKIHYTTSDREEE